MTQLELIISNLKSKPEIDSVFVTGSHGIGEGKNYSDIDLGIVINTETDLKSLFQWVDDKPLEVHFFSRVQLERTIKSDHISPNDYEGLIVGFLEKADIKFDKTGTLQNLKNKYEEIHKNLQVPQSKMIWFDGIINWAYVINKRYFDSDKPEYKESLEIKLLGDLDLLLKGYFEFRNIPWKGEKQVVKYLKENDPTFYDLYMLCIRTTSMTEKFPIYSDLVKRTYCGNYKLWNKEVIFPSASNQSVERQKQLVEFWKKLIS